MKELKFREVKSNLATTIFRALIPGGWLVLTSDEVMHQVDGSLECGWDWRSGITFVPDQNHEWNMEEE